MIGNRSTCLDKKQILNCYGGDCRAYNELKHKSAIVSAIGSAFSLFTSKTNNFVLHTENDFVIALEIDICGTQLSIAFFSILAYNSSWLTLLNAVRIRAANAESLHCLHSQVLSPP